MPRTGIIALVLVGALVLGFGGGITGSLVAASTVTAATGATGTAGTNGANGSAGQNGAAGRDGASGAPGATGARGSTGPTGATGATGASGHDGAAGAAGSAGAAGAQGAPGLTGPAGAAGTFGTAFSSFSGTTGLAPGGPLNIGVPSADNSADGGVVLSAPDTVTFTTPGFYLLTYQAAFTPVFSAGTATVSLTLDGVIDTTTTASGPVALGTSTTLGRGIIRYFSTGDTVLVFGDQFASTVTTTLTATKLALG